MHDNKPKWPYNDDIVLRPHMGSGQWYKTIKGRMHYFGVLADPEAARRRYIQFLNAGEIQQAEEQAPAREDVTINVVVNDFLDKRLQLVDAGEKSAGQFARYRRAGEAILKAFGRNTTVASLTPSAFARFRRTLQGGPVTVGNFIRDVRTIFLWGEAHYGILPRFGDEFRKPSKRAIHNARKVRELWTPGEIRTLLAAASPAMRCFVLLGMNCGFGQGDCSSLTRQVFDLERHWMPRGKNLAERRCPLWPATIAALCDYYRPAPGRGAEHLYFVTRLGFPWVSERPKLDAAGVIVSTMYKDNINQGLRKLCDRTGVTYRPFYTFRHTFRSVADSIGDDTAINCIMGHSAGGMKAVYTQLMAGQMQRLRKVTDCVYHWMHS